MSLISNTNTLLWRIGTRCVYCRGAQIPGAGVLFIELASRDHHCAVQNFEVGSRCWENLWTPGFINASSLGFWDLNSASDRRSTT